MNDYDYEYAYTEDIPLEEEDYDDDESLEEFLEDYDDDEEAAEYRYRGRRRPVSRYRRPSVARGRRYFSPRPTKKYVTQAQLKAGLARVGRDVRKNGAAIRKVNSQVNSLGRTHRRDVGRLRKDLKQARDMALFMMLLQKKTDEAPDDITIGDATNNITLKKGDRLVLSDSDSMLLPLMMFSGGFGTGTGGGIMDNPLMLILLMKGFD